MSVDMEVLIDSLSTECRVELEEALSTGPDTLELNPACQQEIKTLLSLLSSRAGEDEMMMYDMEGDIAHENSEESYISYFSNYDYSTVILVSIILTACVILGWYLYLYRDELMGRSSETGRKKKKGKVHIHLKLLQSLFIVNVEIKTNLIGVCSYFTFVSSLTSIVLVGLILEIYIVDYFLFTVYLSLCKSLNLNKVSFPIFSECIYQIRSCCRSCILYAKHLFWSLKKGFRFNRREYFL